MLIAGHLLTVVVKKFVSPLLHLYFCQWKEFDKIIFNRWLNCLNKNNLEQRGLINVPWLRF